MRQRCRQLFRLRSCRARFVTNPVERAAAMDFSGRTAIVTGAASGIRLRVATALAESRADVAMADIQKDAVEQAAHGLSGTNKSVRRHTSPCQPRVQSAASLFPG